MNVYDFVDARPRRGYLTHAVPYAPGNVTQHGPVSYLTRRSVRTLCGVGASGMWVRTDERGEIQPYKGIDGCDTCFIRVRDIRKEAE